MTFRLAPYAAWGACALAATALSIRAATVYDAWTGLDRLEAALGEGAGGGLTMTQVEAVVPGEGYAPDPAADAWGDVSLVLASGPAAGHSYHATEVARILYGEGEGLTHPNAVRAFSSGHWLTEGFLRAGDPAGAPPLMESADVQCHAWVGRLEPEISLSVAVDATRRFDYAIVRDGFSAVVSLDNGRRAVPELLAHTYNALTVGRLDGNHSRGGTLFEGVGRVRPDVVGPYPATSLNVPLTAGLAGILRAEAIADPALASAGRPECIRALILAGARTDLLPDWSPGADSALDPVYGAGLINHFASYEMLRFGKQAADQASWIQPLGWDTSMADPARRQLYRFSVLPRWTLEDVSIALAWNRQIEDIDPGPAFDPQPRLADLDLNLYMLNGNGIDLVASSATRDGNIELIRAHSLSAGTYVMEVSADRAESYALAWYSRPRAIDAVD